ncbi:MAG TPA: HAD-IA family hydrolase [Gemmatimonadales bacterium]|jgi:pyrophosphatase PpaX|nr:HAD-IA family hydrolase [Gemmatimonadales bacterium]
MPDIHAVLFDLDGTLIDSIGLILASYRHTLSAHGLPPAGDAEWLRGVGRPLRVQLGPWASDPAELEAMVRTYREYNLANHDRMVRVFDGVPELVRRLRGGGRRLGVVTSKTRDGAHRGLRLAGIEDAIEVMVCADDVVHPKPHPEPVTRAVTALGVEPARTLYVGDSLHDLHAGRAAGVLTAAVLWGPFGRQDLEPGAPDFWFERPEEVLEVVTGER